MQTKFLSISSRKIPYLLSQDMKDKILQYESGQLPFPQVMIPDVKKSDCCLHGNAWDDGDPVTEEWVANSGVWIYKESTAIYYESAVVYYRPSIGSCTCKDYN